MVTIELKQFSQNNCSGLQAMIISGGVGQNRGVEVISPSGNVSCSLPNLPGSGRKEHTHDKSLICGGSWGIPQTWKDRIRTSGTCLNLTRSGWVETQYSIIADGGRWRHSSWPVDDGIILMGGYGSRNKKQTDLVKFHSTSEEAFGLKYSTTM